MPDLPFDDLALAAVLAALLHQVHGRQRRSQRIPQLVAEQREEFIFGAIGGFRFRPRRVGARDLFVTLPLPRFDQGM